MRWLACLVVCAGCDVLFRVDAVAPLDARDAPGGGDGGSDDGPTGPSFCAMASPTPSFCADFDTPQTGLTLFVPEQPVGGMLTQTTQDAKTKPGLMSAFAPAASTSASVLASHTITAAPVYYGAIDFELNVPNACDQDVAIVTWPGDGSAVHVGVGTDAIVASFTGTSCAGQKMSTSVTLNAWNQVTISVEPTMVVVSIGGTAGTTFNCTGTLTGDPVLQLGVLTSSTHGDCTTLVDNVIVY